jgi:hypothetical protein
MIGNVLEPDLCLFLREHAEADLQHVHVDKCYLGPIREGGRETKCCAVLA